MMLTKQQALQGEKLPWGYGLAYWLPHAHASVCYPVPFNLVVRWARNLYFWMSCPKPTYKERCEAMERQLCEYRDMYWQLHARHEVLLDLFERSTNLKSQS